ncbi:MAG: hypothetical protein NTY74_10450 [Ignavibacteriae bacterium]|nr:hypothetical protein [Ignavibacteriota bacterium]
MKADKIWDLLSRTSKHLLNVDVHTELTNHLKGNKDYYFEHAYKEVKSNKLLYFENNLLIYFVFENEHFETFYFPVNKIESISKSIGDIMRIRFANNLIETNPEFSKSSTFKPSLDSLFEQILLHLTKQL